jgi:hypothetical protein
MLAAEGFAIFTMNQPLPGHPEVPAGFPDMTRWRPRRP